jgi:3-phosphoshikimate 1-carboxyvinyltransferase
MVENLRRAGVSLERSDEGVEVQGIGGPPRGFGGVFHAKEAGSVLRFLLPFLAAGEGTALLTGFPRLLRRPIGPLVEALAKLGALVSCKGACPPVSLQARGLDGGEIEVSAEVSSQFASALLLAAPAMARGLRIRLVGAARSAPYLGLTVEVMSAFGAGVERAGPSFEAGPCAYRARTFPVEGDASAGSFLLAAAAIAGGRVRVEGVGTDSSQGDIRCLAFLERAGCGVSGGRDWLEVEGPAVRPFDADLAASPDLLPPLAAVAACVGGRSRLRGAPHARLKESDRIAALAGGLARAGALVVELPDGLEIEGRPEGLRGFAADPRGDHRLAMAFALLGLRAPGMGVADPRCVVKSFPEFFERLDSLRA